MTLNAIGPPRESGGWKIHVDAHYQVAMGSRIAKSSYPVRKVEEMNLNENHGVINVHFMERLQSKMEELQSHVCLGMDPRFSGNASIPAVLLSDHDGDYNSTIKEFNSRILESVRDLVPAIKPQIAYYEAFDAMDALEHTIQLAKKHGILVIVDAKRNDIGSTSEAYARAIFDNLGAGCTTVNPYLGSDCILPFLKHEGKGIFVLVKTSNESSIEFQDLFSVALPGIDPEISKVPVGDVASSRLFLERNFIQVARLVNFWNAPFVEISGEKELGPVGAVIGATFPGQLKVLRTVMDNTMFLIPGYGFQGGNASDVKYGFLEGKRGAIINSSRGLLYAYKISKQHACDPGNFEKATIAAIKDMMQSIEKTIGA